MTWLDRLAKVFKNCHEAPWAFDRNVQGIADEVLAVVRAADLLIFHDEDGDGDALEGDVYELGNMLAALKAKVEETTYEP